MVTIFLLTPFILALTNVSVILQLNTASINKSKVHWLQNKYQLIKQLSYGHFHLFGGKALAYVTLLPAVHFL